MVLRLFIALIASFAMLLQPLSVAGTCCCWPSASGDASVMCTFVESTDARVASSCCAHSQETPTHPDDAPDEPVRPALPFGDCDCPMPCCAGFGKLPVGLTPRVETVLTSAPQFHFLLEPANLYLDPYATRLIRPPRALTLG